MPQPRLQPILNHLRRAVETHVAGAPTDAELLARYVADRDQAAFELLVWRHGAMVMQTCRRMLRLAEDAEDAFQATFLALVRRAGSIHKREAVAGWLYKVACRVATRARAQSSRRTQRQRPSVLDMDGVQIAAGEEPDPLIWSEVRQVLDAEVNRLSAKLRDPFILCCLEGLTNEAAAQQLGCPKGTVLSRLSRAREQLRHRLARRGLTLSLAALAGGLSQEAAQATAPAALVLSTVKAATLVVAGNALTGVVSAPVPALTEGVLKAMFLSKLKIATVILLGVGAFTAGTGSFFSWSPGPAQAVAQEQRQANERKAADATKTQTSQDRLNELTVRLSELTAELEVAKVNARKAEIERQVAEERLAQAKAELKQVRQGQEVKAKVATAQVQLPSKKDTSEKPVPDGELGKGLALAGGTTTDLIQLATSYIDAVRDADAAKVRLDVTVSRNDMTEENRAINRINLAAAQRKVALLKTIIESSLKGAESELQRARELNQHQRGYHATSQVTAAETKVRVLKLILKSAK